LQAPHGGSLLWSLGLIGAFLTAFYTFRLFFVVFSGPSHEQPRAKAPRIMVYTLSILAFSAALMGLPELIKTVTGAQGFYDFLHTALPKAPDKLGTTTVWGLQAIYAAVPIAAIGLAYMLYARKREVVEGVLRTPGLILLHRFLKAGWGFDWLYANTIVRSYVWIANVNRDDFMSYWSRGAAQVCQIGHRALSVSVSGNVRWYVAGVAIGSLVGLAFVIFL
jgi:NADH-quinone oxidoreductase subunit L